MKFYESLLIALTHVTDQVGTFDFLTLMQLNIEYDSKSQRTLLKRMKSQRSSTGMSYFLFI